MHDETQLSEIARKLDLVVRLLACQTASRVTDKGGTQKDQITALAAAGLDNTIIANVVGARVEAVRARLSEANRTRKKSKRR